MPKGVAKLLDLRNVIWRRNSSHIGNADDMYGLPVDGRDSAFSHPLSFQVFNFAAAGLGCLPVTVMSFLLCAKAQVQFLSDVVTKVISPVTSDFDPLKSAIAGYDPAIVFGIGLSLVFTNCHSNDSSIRKILFHFFQTLLASRQSFPLLSHNADS